MDPVTLITLVGVIVGIIAGIVAVAQYLEQRREGRRVPTQPSISAPPGPEPTIPNASVQRVKMDQSDYRTKVRQDLTDHFNEEELRTLCFDMGLDYESLPAQGKAGKAREIIAQVERNGAITKLIEQCRRLRPDVHWTGMPEMESGGTTFPGNRVSERLLANNLPRRSEFIGRGQEKSRVREGIASRYPLVCIDGIGGIGKTSLALEVAHEYLAVSQGEGPNDGVPLFDGYIWTSAKDRELRLDDILDTVARTLDYPGITQQPLGEKQESVHRLLQSRRCLLIVDNLETVTDKAVYDFLLALPEPTKALVTSPTQNLEQVFSVSLRGLKQPEGLALIRAEAHGLGLASVAEADENVLLRLYQATDGTPLAIRWALGQIKQKGQSLNTVLDYLYEARGPLFESIFDRSWELLDDRARHVLTVMPFFATSASKDAIEAASDVRRWDLDEALGQLVQLCLVDASEQIAADKRRYSIHPLTRSFCRGKLVEAAGWDQEARLRLARYFTDLAVRNDGWSRREGFPWFEAELANLLAVLDWAYDSQAWSVVVDLMRPMRYFLGVRGYWRERIDYGHKAVESARRLDNPRSEADFDLTVAWVYERQGRFEEAEKYARPAKALMEKNGDKAYLYVPYGILAGVAMARGQENEAAQFATQGLEAAEATGDETSIHLANSLLGRIALETEHYQEAERIFNIAFEGATKLHDEERIGSRNIDLGHAKRLQGRCAEARDNYEAGLSFSRKVGRQDNIGHALFGLARVEAQIGSHQRALDLAKDANDIFARLAMQREEKECLEFIKQQEKLVSESEGQPAA